MTEPIDRFIKNKNIAVVGVSDKKFGGAIYKTLKKRGYQVYPVHPTRETFDGDRAFSRISDLPPSVKAAVVAVSPAHAMTIIKDAKESPVNQLWFQQGPDFSEAIARAKAGGLEVTSGKCILMYAQPVTGIHAFHRLLARLFGKL